MNAASRKRIRDMQRNSRKKQQRKYAVRRIGALVIALAAVILIITAVRGCGGKAGGPVVTVLPGETVSPVTPQPSIGPVGNVTQSDISQQYFANSCFVGNSVIEGMEIYELVDGADYFARIGLNVTDASKLSTSTGSVPVIDELNSSKKYSRIFMMFGENELNWPSMDVFKSDYASLIKKAKKYQPSAKIYLLSVTPISKTADSQQYEGASKDAIVKLNKHIKSIAEANGAEYVDLFTALADKNGFLPEGVAADGIHFDKDYYIKSLVFIQNNYQ